MCVFFIVNNGTRCHSFVCLSVCLCLYTFFYLLHSFFSEICFFFLLLSLVSITIIMTCIILLLPPLPPPLQPPIHHVISSLVVDVFFFCGSLSTADFRPHMHCLYSFCELLCAHFCGSSIHFTFYSKWTLGIALYAWFLLLDLPLVNWMFFFSLFLLGAFSSSHSHSHCYMYMYMYIAVYRRFSCSWFLFFEWFGIL